MKSIIVGTTDLAKLLFFHIQRMNAVEVAAFSVNTAYLNGSEFLDRPLVALENIEKEYSPRDFGIFVAVGYNNMNLSRKKIFDELKTKGYKIESFIHPTATVETQDLGEGNIIFQNVLIDAFCEVGNGNIFYANSMLAHDSVVGNFNFFGVHACVCGNVKIRDFCFLGANCVVRNSVCVENKTLVGASAYLDKDSFEDQVIVPSRSEVFYKKSSELVL